MAEVPRVASCTFIGRGRRVGTRGIEGGSNQQYTKVDGQIAIWWDDDVEKIGVVPHDYEPDEDEDIRVMDDDIMQNED